MQSDKTPNKLFVGWAKRKRAQHTSTRPRLKHQQSSSNIALFVGHVVPPLPNLRRAAEGYTLIEMTLAVLIVGILMIGMDGLLSTALQADRYSRTQNDTMQQARFAMQQMLRAVSGSQRLILPLGENPATAWSESVRDVLAVTMDPTMDRNKDGWADANNDKDYLDLNNNGSRDTGEPERIDEDLGRDNTNDNAKGIYLIDDNGDGIIDNSGASEDNDEDGVTNEDSLNGIDDDGDQSIDEDIQDDMNGDGSPGKVGVDDDFDGAIDEGVSADDDEDGARDEDWLDPVVFFLNGTILMQRIPDLNPSGSRDYTEYPIAENVTQLLIERLMGNDGTTVLVDITLQISPPDMEAINLNTRVRVGASL